MSTEKKRDKSAPQAMSTHQKGGAYSFLARLGNTPKVSDPRFREECGEVDQVGLVKNYSFLQKHREVELAQINKALSDPKAREDRESLKKRQQSLQDQMKTFDDKLKDVEERLKWHREERGRILEGKKPFWLGRREMREKQHQRKFKELKETGKLNKYLIKKGRKQAARDKKRGITAGLV